MRAIRLLPIAFVFTAAMTIVDRGFNDEMQRLAGMRSQFASAVGETRGRLSAIAWTALSDPQIQQNFELGNINTVSQSLQTYIRPGEVSQIDLVDADCQLIARVPQAGKPINDLCQLIKSAKPMVLWQTNEQDDAVLVSVVSKQFDGKTVFAAAQVVFDQAWVSLFPNLGKLVSEREMGFGFGAKGAQLWREGRMSDGRFALPLFVDGWIYRLVPNLTGLALKPQRESFWVLYGALGLLICIALIQVSAKDRQDENERQALESWVRENQTVKTADDHSGHAPILSWSEIVKLARSIVASKDEQRSQQMRLLRDRVESVTNRLRERDMEIAELEAKLVSMSDLASLQEQLQHTSASFLRQMNQMREVCENIYDVASSGLAIQAKSLSLFCARWKEGLSQGTNREIGARKFFRSLVETKGSFPGRSKLDDDMIELEQLTTGALDQSLNAAMLARQAVDDCESASKLAALWHGIATRDKSEKTSDWGSCLISAQRLISADDKYQTMTFETLPQLGTPEEMYPPVTSAVMVSGFFHLYLGLLANTDLKAISLPLVVRQKRFKDQATIILSLPSKQHSETPESPSREMMYHVDLAKQMLSTHGLKVSILPPTVAGYPVGITWSLPRKEVTIVEQQTITV